MAVLQVWLQVSLKPGFLALFIRILEQSLLHSWNFLPGFSFIDTSHNQMGWSFGKEFLPCSSMKSRKVLLPIAVYQFHSLCKVNRLYLSSKFRKQSCVDVLLSLILYHLFYWKRVQVNLRYVCVVSYLRNHFTTLLLYSCWRHFWFHRWGFSAFFPFR